MGIRFASADREAFRELNEAAHNARRVAGSDHPEYALIMQIMRLTDELVSRTAPAYPLGSESMPIVKELSRAAAAPGSPPILGRAAQEIIRQGEEIERLQEVLRTIAFRAQDAKRLCEEGAPISAYNLASGILGQIGGDVAVLTAESR